MTTYLTFDVLEIEPNSRDKVTDTFNRSVVRFDPGLGKVALDDRGGTPVMTHAFNWFLDGRTNIDAFRTFLAARKGRGVPFWMASWRTDMVTVNDLLSTDTTFLIKTQGYTKFQYPSNARRYIAFMLANGTFLYRKITSSVDVGDGTERLTLDASPGVGVPATTMVSFLQFCRLDADSISIQWRSQTFAEAQIPIVEIPRETP